MKGKLYTKNQGPDSRDERVLAIFETERQTLWLIEILYAVKRDLLGFLVNYDRPNDQQTKHTDRYESS